MTGDILHPSIHNGLARVSSLVLLWGRRKWWKWSCLLYWMSVRPRRRSSILGQSESEGGLTHSLSSVGMISLRGEISGLRLCSTACFRLSLFFIGLWSSLVDKRIIVLCINPLRLWTHTRHTSPSWRLRRRPHTRRESGGVSLLPPQKLLQSFSGLQMEVEHAG